MVDDEVRIELDGKSRTIRYTSNALALLEEKTKIKSSTIKSRLAQTFLRVAEIAKDKGLEFEATADVEAELDQKGLNFSILETRGLLWAGLLHEEPTLTLEQAGNLLDLAPVDDETSAEQYVLQACLKAFLLRFGSRRTRTTLKELNGAKVMTG